MSDPPLSELELQRRWAEAQWPGPFLADPQGGAIRVIAPGRWNRGPGPDFRGAQILDREGRARRGDVELHLEAGDWLQHGHSDDPAYDDLLLHVVGRYGRRAADERIPAATLLPSAEPPDSVAAEPPHPLALAANPEAGRQPPCAQVLERAGAAAVEARLLSVARRRFLRKAGELASLEPPAGPGSRADRQAVLAAARALAQPHNAATAELAARRALEAAESWAQLSPAIEAGGWRPGRGALGAAAGWSAVWTTLVRRWAQPPEGPWAAFRRLAGLPRREAIGELRIARRLGPARAAQLLADAVYPLTGAWPAWSQLPGARYLRTAELRERLTDAPAGAERPRAGVAWRHPQTQALLELERTRCRQWACQICPLAALAGRRGPTPSAGRRGGRLAAGGEDGRP